MLLKKTQILSLLERERRREGEGEGEGERETELQKAEIRIERRDSKGERNRTWRWKGSCHPCNPTSFILHFFLQTQEMELTSPRVNA